MPVRVYSFSRWFQRFYDVFLIYIWSLVKRSHLTHMCSGLKPPKILLLISKNHQCLTTLELTNPMFLELRGQKSGYLWEVMGGSFTSGWLSAGNLELQPVANIESLTNRKIRRSGLYSFYEASFESYLGLKMGWFFWRTPFVSAASGRQKTCNKTQRPHCLKLRCTHLRFTWRKDIQAEICLYWNCYCTLSLFLSFRFTVFLGGVGSLSCPKPARTKSRQSWPWVGRKSAFKL